MISITLITGLASLCGCLCMALVCAAQLAELFAAPQPPATSEQPWDIGFYSQPTRAARGGWAPNPLQEAALA